MALSRMRVLVVARSTGGHEGAGGMERVYEDLANHLIGEGCSVALLTTRGVDQDRLSVPYENVWTSRAGTPGKYSRSWWRTTGKRQAPWVEWAPDVILSVSVAGLKLVNAMPNVPVIAQSHGTAWSEVQSSIASPSVREFIKVPLNLARIFREKRAYRRFTKTVAIGPGVEAQLVGAPLKVLRSKVVLISNGVDEKAWSYSEQLASNFREMHGIEAGAIVGLFASRLHRQKGADIAIDALAQVARREDAFLVVSGTGPAKHHLQRLARRRGVESRVIFTGTLNQTELAGAMSASDVMLFPTRRREGLPLTVLEALANGLPVLTVKNAGIPAELRGRAHVVGGNASAFAAAWNKVEPRRFIGLLPGKYHKATALGEYLDLIQACLGEKGQHR